MPSSNSRNAGSYCWTPVWQRDLASLLAVFTVATLGGCGSGDATSTPGPGADAPAEVDTAPATVTSTDESPADAVSAPSLPDVFEDVTEALGIDFVHQPVDHEQDYFMPRIVGSGAAFLDFDQDGLLDIYFVQNNGVDTAETNRLYRQRKDGTFEDVTADSGLGVSGYGMGVAVGDVNNDGAVDVVLNEYGRARLFLNRTQDAQPRFEDVTAAAGIDNRMWGTSTCFFDYDRDGWLDLVLINYVTYDPSRWCADGSGRQDFCGPDAFQGRVTKLYRNITGDRLQTDGSSEAAAAVNFEDVSVSAGLADHPGPGLGVYCADFDGDRFPDIFVANDGKPNNLWMNKRDGTFQDEAVMRGVGYNSMGKSEADMGIAIGDVDGNGLFDIFVTHLSDETHTLWSQGPRGVFTDRTATTGLTSARWRGTGFGTVMVDVDNDGDQDLLIANGRVTRETGPLPKVRDELADFWKTYAQRDQILLNQGGGRFEDASLANPALCGLGTVSRGMACADFNNDGAIDILVTRVGGPPALLRNKLGATGNWLQVRAIDPQKSRDAYGAEVYVTAGENTWMRWINPGYSYLCSNDPRAHFGLGATDHVDSIRVVWPDGSEEQFAAPELNRDITLRRGEGKSVKP